MFTKEGLKHISLENDFVKFTILPEVGGKMIELINKETGTQFLLDPQSEGGKYEKPFYGADFDKFDTSGFDECFPNVSESIYIKENYKHKIVFPDHGELWSRPWDYEINDEKIRLSIKGVRANYEFIKEIRLESNSVVINYKLKNLSSEPFFHMWAAHPLLKVKEGDRLVFPPEIKKVFVNWTSDEKVAKFGDILNWPELEPGVDYSIVKKRGFGKAFKVFSDKLSQGYGGIHYPDTDEALIFEFDTNANEYLGMWICYGGWPVDTLRRHLTVGIEPTSGRVDCLREAMKRKEAQIDGPGEERTWKIKLNVIKGYPIID